MAPEHAVHTKDFDGRRTLILGDVNTGKTRLTQKVLTHWMDQGRSPAIAVLDLAPRTRQGIGGRLGLPDGFAGLYLTAPVTAPRLTARSEDEADALARANAAAIDPLLSDPRLAACAIVVINDVTLYLQAGRYERLMDVLQPAETALVNAYYGDSFPDYRLSRRERHLTDRLMDDCDRVIRLSA